MAIRTQTILVDDLDGSEAAETVTFGLDGDTFEIDLTEENAAALRDLLAPYVEAGRRQTAKRGRGRRGRTAEGSAGTSRSAEIRAWAAAEGLPVNTRGRIPADVIAAFGAAHP